MKRIRTEMNRGAALALAATIAAAPAWAHPGHGGSDFTAGFAHPFSGLDHLLAMLAVGLWAGLVFPRRAWVWPVCFVGFMLAGFVYGASGGALPLSETAILGSVIGLGLAIAFNLRVSIGIGAAIVAGFAIAHGYAHGAEMPRTAHWLGFAGGFALATASLHLIGLALACTLVKANAGMLVRALGAGMAAAGVVMAVWS